MKHRYEVPVSSLSDLKDGDVFLVGSEEWVWDASRRILLQDEKFIMDGLGDRSLAESLIRALGQVSREIPLPEASDKAPLGWRFATEEDRKGPKPSHYFFWGSDSCKWIRNSTRWWTPKYIYAIPITPFDSRRRPPPEHSTDDALVKDPLEIECYVSMFCLGDKRVITLPKGTFEPGQRVWVRKEGGE